MRSIFSHTGRPAATAPAAVPVPIVTGGGEPPGREHLDRLIARLDRSLVRFSSNASAATHCAGNFHAALAETASRLEQDGAGPDAAQLSRLTRTMIERTRTVEGEMRCCQNEASALRKSLDHARRDADVDHLTGLPNRRAFDAVLAREYRAARDAGDSLCLAFCDIDNFRAVNDTHGHGAGDRVLQAVAKVLLRISGHNCHLARHGGEEFVALFGGITAEQARDRLDEARRELSRRKLINRDTDIPIGIVTFSGGVANVLAYADVRSALKAADEALHQAKAQGRNRILLAGQPPAAQS